MGVAGIALCPLKAISERASEIEHKAPVSGAAPGLTEQRAQQIMGLRQGAANVEFLTIPGFYSFPSTFT